MLKSCIILTEYKVYNIVGFGRTMHSACWLAKIGFQEVGKHQKKRL